METAWKNMSSWSSPRCGVTGFEMATRNTGGVTGELVRRWGVHAVHGRKLERDDEIEAQRWEWLTEALGIAG